MTVDRELLKRILEHYNHRIDEFLQDEKTELASGHHARHIADLKREVDMLKEDEIENEIEKKTKARKRTRGPYRKSAPLPHLSGD